MRRSLPLAMLALLGCQLVAYWVLPLANLAHTRAQVTARIREKEGLAVFYFSKKDFGQSRIGRREFLYAGMMHDIAVLHELPGDSVRVIARPDPHESKWLSHFRQVFRSDSAGLPDGSGLVSKMLARFLAEHYLAPEPLGQPLGPDFGAAKPVFFCSPLPPSVVLAVLSPPPDGSCGTAS